jgi:hypothetical protein
MPDWNKTFKAEYDYARGWLANDANFEEDWRPLVRRLHKLMDPVGLDAGQASALTDLRKQITWGDKRGMGHKKVTEDHGILRSVGAWTDDGGGTVEGQAKMRAASLKLLRHVYLLSRAGGRKVWAVSLPKDFNDWPSDDLNARASTQIAARIMLRSHNEIFSRDDKKHLAQATQHALAWCQRVGIVLGNAAAAAGGKPGAKGVAALNLVKRWFADPGTSVADLSTYIAKLQLGFKGIIAMLNRGHFVVTDWVPLRTATTADDLGFLNAEAFTFASNGEGMDVVYIERSFFVSNPGNVVNGIKNWTRIIVHELTHLVCGTEDVNIGQARYAWYGIGPHAGYPGSAAIRNADNWAFFSADCGGALTDGERAMALKIV